MKYSLILFVLLAGCASPISDPVTPPVAAPPVAPVAVPPAIHVMAEPAPADELVLSKETLVASKQETPDGSVVIRKVITSQPASAGVQLRTEGYEVVRTAPSGQAPDFSPREIKLDLKKETPSSFVQAQVVEVVKLKKVVGSQDATVSGQVRSESVEVVRVP